MFGRFGAVRGRWGSEFRGHFPARGRPEHLLDPARPRPLGRSRRGGRYPFERRVPDRRRDQLPVAPRSRLTSAARRSAAAQLKLSRASVLRSGRGCSWPWGLALKIRGHTAERCGEVLRIAGTARGLLGLCLLWSWACGRIATERSPPSPPMRPRRLMQGARDRRDRRSPRQSQGSSRNHASRRSEPSMRPRPGDPSPSAPDLPRRQRVRHARAGIAAHRRTRRRSIGYVPSHLRRGCTAGTCKFSTPETFSCPSTGNASRSGRDAQCSRRLIACHSHPCDIHRTGTSSCRVSGCVGTGPCTIECSGSATYTACRAAPRLRAPSTVRHQLVLDHGAVSASKCAVVWCGYILSAASTARPRARARRTVPPGGLTQGRSTHTCPSTWSRTPTIHQTTPAPGARYVPLDHRSRARAG